MTGKFEKLIEEAKRVSLEKEEKDEIRNFLLSVIKASGPRLKGQDSLFLFRFLFKPVPLVILFALIFSGGVSFASESALPGDFLYPVKINFVEEVRSAFTFSTEAKADFEARRLNKRIEEAEKLSVENRLNSKAKDQIQSSFERSSERVGRKVKKLETDGDFEASAKVNSEFEASLKAHDNILDKILDDADEIQVEIKTNLIPFSQRVKKEAKIAKDSKARAEDIIFERVRSDEKAKAEAEISAKTRFEAAENKIAESKKYIERAKKSVGQEAVFEAEAKILAAENAVLKGRTDMESGDFSEAMLFFQEAFSLAQEAKVLAKAKKDLKIKIKTTNEIELDF
jgi:tetratricopeptide (TPR) repeat protein